MTKKIVFGAALALVIVGLMAPTASAVCADSKSVSTYNPTVGTFNYWKTTLTGAGTSLVAKIWQPGGADVSGTCNTSPGILYFAIAPGDIGMNINLADPCVQPQAACAAGTLAVMATVTKGSKTEFLTTQALETQPPKLTFDFSTFGDHVMVALPRPRVTSSSRAATTVNANLALDAASLGAYEGTAGLVTGYNILSKLAGADPGRNASAYDAAPVFVAATGGSATTAPYVADCGGGTSALNSRWVVTQLVTANGPSPTVSEATRVSCDTSLADPKYKIVPRKNVENSKAKH